MIEVSGSKTITKRHIGLVILVACGLALAGMLALDILGARANNGIGPAQKLALVGCAGLIVLALPLIIYGNHAATGDMSTATRAAPTTSGLIVVARRVLLGIAVILMVWHLVVFLVYSLSLAAFPFDYDQGEGFELNDTVLLSQGQWPYRSNEVYPFYASNYPPLYHLILVPFVWLFGPQYWYGRLAGALATLIAAGAISYAVYRETRHKPVSLLSGLAFLASNYIYHIGPLFRQHMTMVMFETLAVVTIAGITGNDKSRRKIVIGLLFLLAAAYTKQLAIVTAAAIFIYLFLRWPRRAVGWGLAFAIAGGVLFLLLNVITGGQWWLNIVTANVNQYIISQFTGLLGQFVGLHGALLLLAGAFALYEVYWGRISLYTIWFLVSAVGSISAGKWGAGDSYFSTLIAAMCILAGIFTARCLNRSWHIPPAVRGLINGNFFSFAGIVACAGFIFYSLAVVHVPLDGLIVGPAAQALNIKTNTKFPNFYDSAGWTMGYATIGQIPTAEDVTNGWKIVAAAKTEKPILSEEAAFSFLNRQPVVTNPTQLLNLYQNGHYDPSTLVRMIDEQAFGAVIFRARFYPQPVLDAVDRAYIIQHKIPMNGFEYVVLLPNLDWHAPK